MDDGRCTLSDRLPGGLSGEVVMAGSSNGGNLAWATAADTEVEIPVLSGIASFESPISSQMMTVEPGGEAEPAEFFRAGHCELDETLHMSCDHGYAHIAFDPSASEETDGVLFIDENDDQLLSPGESTLDPVFSPADDAWIHPTEALMAAADLPLVRRADAATAERFWAEREATQQLRGAAARFPSLAGIATGTEVDHILTGLELPVHVTGLVSAMQSAALSWSRLHPDAAYVAQLTGFKEAQEYEAPPEYGARGGQQHPWNGLFFCGRDRNYGSNTFGGLVCRSPNAARGTSVKLGRLDRNHLPIGTLSPYFMSEAGTLASGRTSPPRRALHKRLLQKP